jgi:hypothetical protein
MDQQNPHNPRRRLEMDRTVVLTQLLQGNATSIRGVAFRTSAETADGTFKLRSIEAVGCGQKVARPSAQWLTEESHMAALDEHSLTVSGREPQTAGSPSALYRFAFTIGPFSRSLLCDTTPRLAADRAK